MNAATVFSRRWILTTALVLLGAATCARLGIWQLDRLETRKAFNAHVMAMRALPALQLPSVERLSSQEYRLAQASGVYDFGHQVAIRNQAYQGQYGYRLLTPLLIEGTTAAADGAPAAILVDRGWIPAEGNAKAEDWRKYDESGQTVVRGVVRLGQDGPAFGAIAQPTTAPGQEWPAFWMYVDIPQIARQLPYAVLPVYLQSDGDLSALRVPIPTVPALELTEGPHRGYAGQWFAFAAILLVGFPFYVRKKEAAAA